jgi:hypothetical protein
MMINFWIGLLVGCGIYWIISLIIWLTFEFNSDKEQVTIMILGGPLIWITFLGYIIYCWVKHLIKVCKYKSLIVDLCTETIYYCNPSKVSKIIDSTNGRVTWLYHCSPLYERVTKSYKKYFKDGKINCRYVPKIIWKQYQRWE